MEFTNIINLIIVVGVVAAVAMLSLFINWVLGINFLSRWFDNHEKIGWASLGFPVLLLSTLIIGVINFAQFVPSGTALVENDSGSYVVWEKFAKYGWFSQEDYDRYKHKGGVTHVSFQVAHTLKVNVPVKYLAPDGGKKITEMVCTLEVELPADLNARIAYIKAFYDGDLGAISWGKPFDPVPFERFALFQMNTFTKTKEDELSRLPNSEDRAQQEIFEGLARSFMVKEFANAGIKLRKVSFRTGSSST